MTIKDRVKTLCSGREISVQQLETELGFGSGTISRWDDKMPNVDRVMKVAEYFSVSVDSIVGRGVSSEELPRNEHEAAVLARYNSLSAENRALIDELMEKLKSQK